MTPMLQAPWRGLALAAALVSAAALPASAGPADDSRRRLLEELRGKGAIPLVDLSSTFNSLIFNPEPLAERLEELGVALMGVTCVVWPSSPQLCGGLRPEGLGPRFLALANGDLPHAALLRGKPASEAYWERFLEEARGGGRVLGPLQFFLRPSGVPGERGRAPQAPDPALLGRVAGFCGQEGFVLQVVADADDGFLQVLEGLLSRHPKARVIWSRACERDVAAKDARREARQARGLLERFPNLYLDLAYRGVRRVSSDGDTDPVLTSGGALYPDWKKLIEEKPGRVLSGLGLSPRTIARLPAMVARQRAILSQLDRRVRPAVAYQTAWKLLFDESF